MRQSAAGFSTMDGADPGGVSYDPQSRKGSGENVESLMPLVTI